MAHQAKSISEKVPRISQRNPNPSVRNLLRDTRLLKQVIQDLARQIELLEKAAKQPDGVAAARRPTPLAAPRRPAKARQARVRVK